MRLASSLGKDAMVRDAVKDVQEGLGEPQEIAEAVEAEVDELPGEFDHLEGELVLLRVAEGPHVVDDVLEVRLDEDDCGVEARANHLFGRVRSLVGVVTEKNHVPSHQCSCSVNWTPPYACLRRQRRV